MNKELQRTGASGIGSFIGVIHCDISHDKYEAEFTWKEIVQHAENGEQIYISIDRIDSEPWVVVPLHAIHINDSSNEITKLEFFHVYFASKLTHELFILTKNSDGSVAVSRLSHIINI